MPEAATATSPRKAGGRPRQYADQGAFEALVGRVSVLEVRGPAIPVLGDVAPPVADDTDKRFVGDCITALIASGRFSGGDADLAPISSVVNALVITRDLILANLGTQRERVMRHLREEGYLSHFGIEPEERAA